VAEAEGWDVRMANRRSLNALLKLGLTSHDQVTEYLA
jgi:hypothetical protein